jgi:hypothetical protein
MRLDQYSSKRNARPGFPSAEEIKKTTEAWKGNALARQQDAEGSVNDAAKPARPPHF